MCMGTGRILQKTSMNITNLTGKRLFLECILHTRAHTFCVHHTRMGMGCSLEKVVLNFPKVMYEMLYTCITRLCILYTYMLYTFTYRGVCVMCIHINNWMRVTWNDIICNIRGRTGNMCWGVRCLRYLRFLWNCKIFVKFLRFSRILAKILIVLNFRPTPDPPTGLRVPRTSPADIFSESLYPPVVFIFWYNFMLVAFR